MEQTIKINVTISKYVYGRGKQYTSDIEPLEVDEETLKDQVLLQKAIDEYCYEWAVNTEPYDTGAEAYYLEFWADGVKVGEGRLNDYADYFGYNL